MRILMLNYEFPPIGGGAANANFYLLKEFSKKKIEIDLITSSKDKFKTEHFSDNIQIHKLDVNKKQLHYWGAREAFDYTVKAYMFSKGLIKKKKYDLCHSFFALPTGIIAKALKLPYIVSLRGSDVPGFNKRLERIYGIQKPVFSYVCKNAKKVVANSQGLKELAQKSYEGKIDIIYNGIDTKQFVPGKNGKSILCVSRLIPRKGLLYLIEAMPEILKKHGTNLVIIGEGPQKQELAEKIKSLNIEDKVTFHDYVKHDELPKYYKEACAFILPSANEGMSNTILEAMSSSLPIITTKTGGAEELIKGNGILIKEENIKDIIKAADMLLSNKELRKEYGDKSRKIAEKMSWENAAKAYLHLYQAIER